MLVPAHCASYTTNLRSRTATENSTLGYDLTPRLDRFESLAKNGHSLVLEKDPTAKLLAAYVYFTQTQPIEDEPRLAAISMYYFVGHDMNDKTATDIDLTIPNTHWEYRTTKAIIGHQEEINIRTLGLLRLKMAYDLLPRTPIARWSHCQVGIPIDSLDPAYACIKRPSSPSQQWQRCSINMRTHEVLCKLFESNTPAASNAPSNITLLVS